MNTTLNISMPAKMKTLLQKRVKSGVYSTPSDYIRTLIRQDLAEQEHARLDTLVAEGIASGPAKIYSGKDWNNLEKRVAKSLKAKRAT